MKLFLSHASEDKDDFVRPLAEVLRRSYEVWYDEYELTLGDSLLQKINQGLASCDFGIVVLSHAFFSKKWPQAELDGMFALETTTRKLILPIWKGVTVEDVKRYSPILAGRLAASADKGIDGVVSEIRRAIEVSERTRQLDVLQSTVKRVRALDQTLKEKQDSSTLLMTVEGVRLVDQEIAKLYDSLDQTLSQVAQDSSVLKFTIQRPVAEVLNIHGAHRVTLGMGVRGERFSNSAERVLLCAAISLRNIGQFGSREAPDFVEQLEFKPSFRTGKQVVWLAETGRKTFTTEELIAYLIDILIREIERQAGGLD